MAMYVYEAPWSAPILYLSILLSTALELHWKAFEKNRLYVLELVSTKEGHNVNYVSR